MIRKTLVRSFHMGLLAAVTTVGTVSFLQAQNLLNEPESVVYDSPRNRYLVSNQRDGNIVEIDSSGAMRLFSSALFVARGMQIVGDTLYVTSGRRFAAFNLLTAQQTVDIPISGAQFLNDVVLAAGNLYISDSFANQVFKFNLQTQSVSTFVSSGLSFPNGLLLDQANNRLLLVSFRSQSPVQAISLADSSVSTVVPTNFTNLDGLAMDRSGYIYVSSFGNGIVVRYSPDFSSGPETISSGHSAPADIFINNDDDILAIPNLGGNRVDFRQITPVTSVPEEPISPRDFRLMQNYPNPFNPTTRIQFELAQAADITISIYDISGKFVRNLLVGLFEAGRGAVVWDGTNDAGDRVASGVYLYKMSAAPLEPNGSNSVTVATRRMLLLK